MHAFIIIFLHTDVSLICVSVALRPRKTIPAPLFVILNFINRISTSYPFG
jgi:hypothetical protein